MAYSTNMSVAPKKVTPIAQGPMSSVTGQQSFQGPMSSVTGQQSFQVSQPAPMYTAPAAAPKANTAPLVQAVAKAPAAPVAAPVQTQAPAANDYNSPANVAARAQLAQEAANNAQYGNPQGIAPQYTAQQMSQMAQSQANPGVLYSAAAGQNGQSYQTYTQPTYTPSPLVTPLQTQTTAQRTADGGYTGLSLDQAKTIFGTNFTGVDANPDGTFSVSALALQNRAQNGYGTNTGGSDMINNLDGTYAVNRPVAWTATDERILSSAQTEMNAIEQQNARPGTDPSIIANNQYRLNYLREQVNSQSQRKQALQLSGAQDLSGLSDQQYLESLLTNPDLSEDQVANARNAVGLNQDTYAKQAKQAADAAAAVAMTEINRNYTTDRDKLLAQLSLRGLSPDSDSYAQTQLRELDSRYNDLRAAQNAQAMAAQVAVDDKTRAYLTALADKRIEEAHKRIADQVAIANASANAYSKTTNADTNTAKLDITAAKNKADADYKSGKLSVDQYNAEINKLNQESQTDLRASQANLNDANADYVTGAKTDNTQADTGLKEANTNKINTLLPAQLAQLQAQTAKLVRQASGAGGKAGGAASATPDELAAVVRLNGGKAPVSAASMATLLNQVRTVNGNVDNLVKVANDAAHDKKVATTVSTSGFVNPFLPK